MNEPTLFSTLAPDHCREVLAACEPAQRLFAYLMSYETQPAYQISWHTYAITPTEIEMIFSDLYDALGCSDGYGGYPPDHMQAAFDIAIILYEQHKGSFSEEEDALYIQNATNFIADLAEADMNMYLLES